LGCQSASGEAGSQPGWRQLLWYHNFTGFPEKWCTRMKLPSVLEVIGYSGSGKTTLIEKLIPELRQDGVRLAVIKHTSHQHELDLPGKDSHRLRTAGAEAVFVSSPKMVAMFRDIEDEWPIARMLHHLPRDLDLVIAEGFKHGGYPCIEVFRQACSEILMSRGRPNLMAVIGDNPGDLVVPHFPPNAIAAIRQFILERVMLSLRRNPRHRKLRAC